MHLQSTLLLHCLQLNWNFQSTFTPYSLGRQPGACIRWYRISHIHLFLSPRILCQDHRIICTFTVSLSQIFAFIFNYFRKGQMQLVEREGMKNLRLVNVFACSVVPHLQIGHFNFFYSKNVAWCHAGSWQLLIAVLNCTAGFSQGYQHSPMMQQSSGSEQVLCKCRLWLLFPLDYKLLSSDPKTSELISIVVHTTEAPFAACQTWWFTA